MKDYKLISSDSHIVEPADVWEQRIDKRFKDRAPQVFSEEDGDWWYVDGIKTTSPFVAGGETGVRLESPEELQVTGHAEGVRPGAYIPEEFVKDNEMDGIETSIIFPGEALAHFWIPDAELVSACFRAYNEWISEFCSSYPKQLKGIGIVNLDDVEEGVKELDSVREKGLVGALITIYPHEDRAYDSPEYEPLWARAQDLDMPLCLHVGTNRVTPERLGKPLNPHRAQHVAQEYWIKVSLGNMLFAGVFDRYPRLKVASVENNLSWVPYFLYRMDYDFTQTHRGVQLPRYKGGLLPSDHFHRNISVSFQEDPLGVRDRAIIGVDNLMWGSDYPHPESTFPKSQEIVDEILEGVPEVEQRKILRDNAARVFQLN